MSPNSFVNFTSDQMNAFTELDHLNITQSEFLLKVYGPIINELNDILLPGLFITWFSLGITIYDTIFHVFPYDIHFIQNWKWRNLLYFTLRYIGLTMSIMLVMWTVLGQTNSCFNISLVANILMAIVLFTSQVIFSWRLAALWNWNKIILVISGILSFGTFGILLKTAIGTNGYNFPVYLPLIMCIPSVKYRYDIILTSYSIALFDFVNLVLTLWAVRTFIKHEIFKPHQENSKGSILRKNIIYMIILILIDIIASTPTFFTLNSSNYLIGIPLIATFHIIFGCRVFIQSEFFNSLDTKESNDMTQITSSPMGIYNSRGKYQIEKKSNTNEIYGIEIGQEQISQISQISTPLEVNVETQFIVAEETTDPGSSTVSRHSTIPIITRTASVKYCPRENKKRILSSSVFNS